MPQVIDRGQVRRHRSLAGVAGEVKGRRSGINVSAWLVLAAGASNIDESSGRDQRNAARTVREGTLEIRGGLRGRQPGRGHRWAAVVFYQRERQRNV